MQPAKKHDSDSSEIPIGSEDTADPQQRDSSPLAKPNYKAINSIENDWKARDPAIILIGQCFTSIQQEMIRQARQEPYEKSVTIINQLWQTNSEVPQFSNGQLMSQNESSPRLTIPSQEHLSDEPLVNPILADYNSETDWRAMDPAILAIH